jgi:hypothetical protein
MHQALLILTAILSGSTVCFAQTRVEELPKGCPIRTRNEFRPTDVEAVQSARKVERQRMQRFWFLAAALIFAGSPALAQAPVNNLPQGRQVAGWAVEAIPVEQSRPPELPTIARFAGQSGLARYSVEANSLSSSRFDELVSGRQRLLFNGRAFFRVQTPQRYQFVASVVAKSRDAPRDCEFVMSVGGNTIISRKVPVTSTLVIITRRGESPKEGTVLSGSVDLQPGFYPVEYIAGCPWSSQPVQLQVQFSVRDERDAVPRDYADGELFHVQR